jgi:hypothetical protein
MSCHEQEADSDFVAPTEQLLNNLGPGCYIKVRDGENCFWAEVSSTKEGEFTGVIHNELASPKCQTKIASASEIAFHHDQIVALGCDRYCNC